MAGSAISNQSIFLNNCSPARLAMWLREVHAAHRICHEVAVVALVVSDDLRAIG
jgi:hypothetical protein